MKVLVAYDGTLQSKDALKYGVEKVREKGGELIALQIFNNRLYVDYDATPYAEELGRREARVYLEDAKKILSETGSGVKTSIYTGDGNPEEEIINFAQAENVDVLLCPPSFKSIVKRFRKALDEQGKKATEAEILDTTASGKSSVEVRVS